MYWLLQNNICSEKGYNDLITLLFRMNINHSIHKVIPFVGDIEPDINIYDEPVFCFGSYSLWRVAKKKNWKPGMFMMEHAQFEEQKKHWDRHLLNQDAVVTKFKDFEPSPSDNFFIRPLQDSKTFAGTEMIGQDFLDWQRRVVDLKEDDGSTINGDTEIMVATPKSILKEYRFWIVDGHVTTWSQYKVGQRVWYTNDIEKEAISFAVAMAGSPMSVDYWSPSKAFVLDICLTANNQFKIVEAQCINASGLYAADVNKLVMAIEDLTRYYR